MSIAFGGDTNVQHNRALSPLELWILALLSTQGPLREIDMLMRSPENSLETITRACLELQRAKLIELPSGIRPLTFTWRLTEQGRKVTQ